MSGPGDHYDTPESKALAFTDWLESRLGRLKSDIMVLIPVGSRADAERAIDQVLTAAMADAAELKALATSTTSETRK